jgi:glycosyltransferase involved in cell wall biosynthesis
MADVTVIVPLYNKAPHVRRCLDSLCGQTLADLRIIVVDDGSTDDGAAIVSEMASADARIQLIRQDNCGPAAARNTGIAAATSEFIGFVDADDWVEPEMFALLRSAARRFDCISARCGYALGREVPPALVRQPPRSVSELDSVEWDTPLRIVRGAELYDRLFSGPDISLMTACTAIYRREALASHSIIFDERLRHTEDALFSAEVYSLDMPIAVARSGWFSLRATGPNHPDHPGGALEAHASPVYVEVAGKPAASREDAEYFLKWIERLSLALRVRDRVPGPEARRQIETQLDAARGVYAKIVQSAE